MSKCALGIIGGSGIYDLPGLTNAREQKVATFKLPERLEIVDELPRSAIGKVLKRELKARLVAEQASL